MTLEELLRQGKSFGQGASNAAASTVTGPVDMLAWLLRKGGVNVGDAPMGGEAWMRQKGLMATPENRLAGLLGEGAGLAAPIVAAAKAPEIAGGLLQMGRNLATPQTMNKQTGAIVYHGSPHKFDKFDSSKIGTGEGAQAYGHGLYLAESPDVAKGYASANMGRARAGDGFLDSLPPGAQTDAYNLLQSKVRGPVGDARLEALRPSLKPEQFRQLEAAYRGGDSSLYKVDLPDDAIAKMLDWDKPLSQQHPEVNAKLKHALGSSYKESMYGEDAYRRLQKIQQNQAPIIKKPDGAYRNDAVVPQMTSDALRQSGIPGIRYLDGGSRSAGAGSSNFVVFPGNEGLLKILERNGGKP